MSVPITDPQVLAFIEMCDRLYADAPGRAHITRQRADYERLAACFQAPRPAGLAIEDTLFDGPGGPVPVRRYWSGATSSARVLFFHGGGYTLGGLDSHDSIAAEIAAGAGCELVAVAYRLAPEYPHPAAYEDALAAIEAFGDRPLVVMGDSAGGNLAAAVAQTRDSRIVGQVLIYPDLGGITRNLPSYAKYADAPLLATHDVHAYRRARAGGLPPRGDPAFDPLTAAQVAGVAPAFISTAEVDPLRDDGAAYGMMLTEAGVATEVVIEPELPHGHLRARHQSARAGAAFGRIVDAVRRLGAPA